MQVAASQMSNFKLISCFLHLRITWVYTITNLTTTHMYYLLPIQVLKVVNPKCTYTCREGGPRQQGVAIILKELLQLLDNYSISHAGESSIRRELRKRNDCKTSGNQFFLNKNSHSNTIVRRRKNGDVRNVSCVIIPSKDVPDLFFRKGKCISWVIWAGYFEHHIIYIIFT